MARLEALKEMEEKVIAGSGEPSARSWMRVFGIYPDNRHILASRAYRGSLDAAVSLLEDLLPGYALQALSVWPGEKNSYCELWGTHLEDGEYWHGFDDGKFVASAGTPARALLLCIVRALIAQEEGK